MLCIPAWEGRRRRAGLGHGLLETPQYPQASSAQPPRPDPGPPASIARGEATRTRAGLDLRPSEQLSLAPALLLPTARALVPAPAAAVMAAAPPLQRRWAGRGRPQRWSSRGTERPRVPQRRAPCRREARTAAQPITYILHIHLFF